MVVEMNISIVEKNVSITERFFDNHYKSGPVSQFKRWGFVFLRGDSRDIHKYINNYLH